MVTAKQIVSRQFDNYIALPVVLFFMMNIGNYSFFRYSVYGTEIPDNLLNILSNIRFVIPVWIVLYAFRFNTKLTSQILTQNVDIIFLSLSWLLSSVLSMDNSSYLLYGLWSLLSLWAIVIFVSYAAMIYHQANDFLSNIISIIWRGNFIILGLDLVSFALLKPRDGLLQLFFSSNTFWAYPTMLMGTLALVKIRFFPAYLVKKLYFLVIFGISLVAVYMSARRAPLFCLILTLPLLYLPLKFPQILIVIFLSIGCISVSESELGKDLLGSLPDSYMKYRVERMFGLIHGREETSYAERQKLWDIYLNAFYEKPVFGEGLAAVKRIGEKSKANWDGLSAHNTFIGLLSETGLCGALLLFATILKSVALVVKVNDQRWKKIYIILFIPTLLINWVEYNLIPGQIFFLYTMIIWLLPRGLCYNRHDLSNPLKKTKT